MMKYQKYDNYNAINVDRIKDIPRDYDGVMGVPVTFFDTHNPEQFEVVGATECTGRGASCGLFDKSYKEAKAMVNGKCLYKRVFIKRIK